MKCSRIAVPSRASAPLSCPNCDTVEWCFNCAMNPSSAARSKISAGSFDIHLYHSVSTRAVDKLRRDSHLVAERLVRATRFLENNESLPTCFISACRPDRSLVTNLNSMMMLGQSACSAKRSMAVSSYTEDAIAPAFVAPMPRDNASAVARPLPVPSFSTETKQGKPFCLTYKLRTDEPIILVCS